MVYVPPSALQWLDLPNKWRQEREAKGIKPFSYFDTRADEEGLQKMVHMLYHCTKAGIGVGIMDAVAISHVNGMVPLLGRIGYWALPIATAGGAFVATTFFLTRLTGEDSRRTHFLGGVAAASVFGAKWQSYRVGVGLSLILGTWALLKKRSIDLQEPLAPSKRSYCNFFLLQRCDWTIMKP